VRAFRLTTAQAAKLRRIIGRYKPKMGESWKHRSDDQLWLRVLSQIVVAGNAAPGDVLRTSQAVREKLGFSQLKRLSPTARSKRIHIVLRAIGTRYVGKNSGKNKKVKAAIRNFQALLEAGGPRQFFERVNSFENIGEKMGFLSQNLSYYKKKGTRDTLIDLGLATNCIALDQRLMQILQCVRAKVPLSIDKHYIDRHYEEIERELICRVATPCHLSGGELDHILFQNYGDIMVRLLCP
jgi:hypothetical protein